MKKASWEVQAFEGDPAPLVIVDGETCIAECFVGDGGESVEKAITNARLIAAAPELFAALEAILNAGDLSLDLILMAERAVIKASGWSFGIDCAAKTEDEEKLRAFSQEIMSHWPEDGVDGDDLQEIAIKHGLLDPKIMYAPCEFEGGCVCSGYVNSNEFARGVTCFMRTELLMGVGK